MPIITWPEFTEPWIQEDTQKQKSNLRLSALIYHQIYHQTVFGGPYVISMNFTIKTTFKKSIWIFQYKCFFKKHTIRQLDAITLTDGPLAAATYGICLNSQIYRVFHQLQCRKGALVGWFYYSDVIMSAIASQITGVSIAYSNVC